MRNILWHQALKIRHAMADITIADITPKGPKKRSRILKGGESYDPNDAAIKLVTRLVLLRPKPGSRARVMVHFSLCERSNRFLESMKSFPIVNIMFVLPSEQELIAEY